MSGVGLTGIIRPLNGASFPVFEDINGLGGLRVVADAAERDAIPANFKKPGMVAVLAETQASYQWNGTDWVDYAPGGGGAGGTPLFKNTLYVTSTATPNAQVFNTLQAACSAVVPGTATMILVAPETFTEDVVIPHGLVVALVVYEYAGVKAVLNGNCTWDLSTPDFLAFTGFELPGGIALQDHGTTNGPAALRITDCFVDGLTSTLTHAVVSVTATATAEGGCVLSNASHVNGDTFVENAAVTGALTTTTFTMVSSGLANNVTATDMIMIASEFVGLVTLNISNSLTLDDYSAFQARTGMNLTGGATVHLASGTSLEQHPFVGGATPTFDWTKHSAYSFTLDQNCVPIFTPPKYSQLLTVLLVQGGAERFTFQWPANVFNPPTLTGLGQQQFLLYYCLEVNKYYPIVQAPSFSTFTLANDGSGTPEFDWALHSHYKYSMAENTFPTFDPPNQSQWLVLTLAQNGGFQFNWPANTQDFPVSATGAGPQQRSIPSPPTSTYLIFYSKEADKYYPLGQTSDVMRDTSTFLQSLFGGAPTSIATTLSYLNIATPFNKGGYVFAGAASPQSATMVANIPEVLQYQVCANMSVDAHVTSGTYVATLGWSDENNVNRTAVLVSCNLGATSGPNTPDTDYQSGTLNITCAPASDITISLAIGVAAVPSAPDVHFTCSVQRLTVASIP